MSFNKYLATLLVCITSSVQILAQDWANFSEFRAANEALTTPKSGENRIVFMGNSITIGWLQTHPSSPWAGLWKFVDFNHFIAFLRNT